MTTDLPAALFDPSELRLHLAGLLKRLTLERKVQLLTGADFWSTVALDEIGLRSMVLSDGPSGVRGARWDERDPSLSFPSATALSSSWDTGLAYRYGAHAAAEARRKGVDVILGPTINLHRSPLGGRGFECFSEDPTLTAHLAAGYVSGVQSSGVAATVKHFVANDFETDRLTASADVGERALRELYLLAFEKPVRESHAWLVMSAYNSINGVTATEHPLLEDPLKSEWEFDGVIVSDWDAVRSLASAAAMQDLVMPGPDGPWGDDLVAAVRTGQIDEGHVDDKVLRLLLLATRVGALDSVPFNESPEEMGSNSVEFVRRAEASGMVLLRNEGRDGAVLPLERAKIGTVGVFGQNARFARTQGGGSATVVPDKTVSPLEGIVSALGIDRVIYSPGVGLDNGLVDFPLQNTKVPDEERAGVLVQLFEGDRETHRETRGTGMLVDLDPDAPLDSADRVVVTTDLTIGDLGWMQVGFAALGRTVLYIDDALFVDETLGAEGNELGATFLTPPVAARALPAHGERIRLRYENFLRTRPSGTFFSFTFGLLPQADSVLLLDAAAEAARACDYAVVVVGTSAREESEGFDRISLVLPGEQDALVRAIAATGTPTIVVVNSGGPVEMPWSEDVDAVLVSWFGGQEYGNAVADVLLGDAEPGGRLPLTWPAEEKEVPVLDVTPIDGVVRYDEGIFIGYRAWLAAGTRPAFEFGSGYGYSRFTTASETGTPVVADDGVDVRVSVTNVGERHGKHVVQVYATRTGSEVELPARWLVGFAPVIAAPNDVVTTTIHIPRRAFAYWDLTTHSWAYELGTYDLHIARSLTNDDEVLPITLV